MGSCLYGIIFVWDHHCFLCVTGNLCTGVAGKNKKKKMMYLTTKNAGGNFLNSENFWKLH